MTFGIGGAHDVGFVRLHGGDLTTIEGEEFATDDGQFSLLECGVARAVSYCLLAFG